jgi:hypothetical protein
MDGRPLDRDGDPQRQVARGGTHADLVRAAFDGPPVAAIVPGGEVPAPKRELHRLRLAGGERRLPKAAEGLWRAPQPALRVVQVELHDLLPAPVADVGDLGLNRVRGPPYGGGCVGPGVPPRPTGERGGPGRFL